jgi:glycosidase
VRLKLFVPTILASILLPMTPLTVQASGTEPPGARQGPKAPGSPAETYDPALISMHSPKVTSTTVQAPIPKGAVTATKSSQADWWLNRTVYEFNEQQYTPNHTFKEFAKYLPQLKALGVGIIWFMPPFPRGPSGSLYAPTDPRSIDPMYGDFAEFKALVDKIHSMAMYVILDFVPNHMAWTTPWIAEHPDWFMHGNDGGIIPGSPDWTDVAKLNWSNPALRTEMMDIWKYWVSAAGVDGFRFDYAVSVPPSVYVQARTALNQIKPVFFLCEGSDSENPTLAAHCDMTYAWSLPDIFADIARGVKSATAIDEYLTWEHTNLPASHIRMRYTSNHDLGATMGGSFTTKYGGGVRTFAVLTTTLPGKPLLYNGQEVGLPTSYGGINVTEVADFSTSPYRAFYTKLLNLYQTEPALYQGSFSKLISNQDSRVYAFARESGKSRVVVIVNLSSSPADAAVDIGTLAGTYTDALAGGVVPVPAALHDTIPAWGYSVLVATD